MIVDKIPRHYKPYGEPLRFVGVMFKAAKHVKMLNTPKTSRNRTIFFKMKRNLKLNDESAKRA
jgi:hypothetical protein